MTRPRHLQLINTPLHGDEAAFFVHFPLLPAELRLNIWILALERRRLIEVTCHLPVDFAVSPPYSSINKLGNIVSGQHYTVRIEGLRQYSKLLHVSREARKAALGFHRIHIPCRYQVLREKDAQGTFYFNPEFDILHLSLSGSVERGYVDLLHDIKALDPRGIGLLNVAFDSNSLLGFEGVVEIPEGLAQQSFTKSLSQIREIIWVAESHNGRSIMGPAENFQGVGVRFNHSMPIKTITPSFDILGPDPRLVGPELQFVLTGATDPRFTMVRWKTLLQRWNICQAQPPKERVLFAYKPPSYMQQVYDNRTANYFLVDEDEDWLRSQRHWQHTTLRLAGRIPVEGPEELAEAVRPAVGFWLFPTESLGPMTDVDISRNKKVFDMRKFWPELALSEIG